MLNVADQLPASTLYKKSSKTRRYESSHLYRPEKSACGQNQRLVRHAQVPLVVGAVGLRGQQIFPAAVQRNQFLANPSTTNAPCLLLASTDQCGSPLDRSEPRNRTSQYPHEHGARVCQVNSIEHSAESARLGSRQPGTVGRRPRSRRQPTWRYFFWDAFFFNESISLLRESISLRSDSSSLANVA